MIPDLPTPILISIIALLISAWSLRIALLNRTSQAKSQDIANTLDIVKQITEAQRRVSAHLSDPVNAKADCRELLNLLEACAFLINHQLLPPAATALTSKYIIEVMATFYRENSLREFLRSLETTSETFHELYRFASERSNSVLDMMHKLGLKEKQ